MDTEKLRDIFTLLIWFVPYYLAIAFDDLLVYLRLPNPFLSLPRSIAEAVSPKHRLFEWIRKRNPDGVIPKASRFVDCVDRGGALEEPDKSVVCLSIAYERISPLSATTKPQQRPLDVFVKCPTCRQWPRWFRTILSVYTEVAKEVAWYEIVFPELVRIRRDNLAKSNRLAEFDEEKPLGYRVPLPVAGCSVYSRTFNRTMVTLQCIDTTKYAPGADYKNASLDQVHAILDSISHLHALTWRMRDPRVRAVAARAYPKERRGLSFFASAVEMFLHRLPPAHHRFWAALSARLADDDDDDDVPMVIGDGDLRFGNCMYNRENPTDVIVTDLEAVSVVPYLWDVCYLPCCSLPPSERRAHQPAIVARYLERLRTVHNVEDAPSLESAMRLVPLMQLAMAWFAYALSQFGGVGDRHGNSASDMASWEEKTVTVVDDALSDEAALAATLRVDVQLVRDYKREVLEGRRK